MDIQESGEMYLETILLLSKRQAVVRSVDIVNELNYTKSSVSRAVNLLKDKGYIEIDSDGAITFTATGKNRAELIFSRHNILKDFLLQLGVDEETAESDACRIEHIISDETLEAIKRHLK